MPNFRSTSNSAKPVLVRLSTMLSIKKRPHSYAMIENYRDPTFDIFFGKGDPFDGKPILPTLKQLSQRVSGVEMESRKSL